MTHGCFLLILQLLPHFSIQGLGAVTVDCAQVWLARPQRSTELKQVIPAAKTVKKTLTRVQAVVTVGILDLQHQATEKPVRPLPLGKGTRNPRMHVPRMRGPLNGSPKGKPG